MITIRKSQDRGHADHGWLDTYHTFSFASYRDPKHVHFRSLRVINEDRVAAKQGFGMHPHQDMEIITWVLSGSLKHRDSMGHEAELKPGEIQRISAGTGILHSETNPSATDPVHLLQIWIMPDQQGVKPAYAQQAVPAAERTNQLRLIVSPDGRAGSISIHQDADLYAALLDSGRSVTHTLRPGRHGWLQVAKGAVSLNGQALDAGDGAAVTAETDLEIRAAEDSEVLLFDLA